MKIKFVIGYPIKCCVSEWTQILEHKDEELLPDIKTFQLFKALELNSEIEPELIHSRKELKIHDAGLSWERFQRYKNHDSKSLQIEIDESISWISGLYKEASRIRQKLLLHPQIEEQLPNLILGNFVEPDYRGITYGCRGANVGDYESIDDFDENVEVNEITINISKRTSKNELTKYIDNNWEEIAKLLELLPEEKNFFISKRDVRIVELRDQKKLKYDDIADIIVEEFSLNDLEGSINEDTIKTAYTRAKAKINELANLQTG